MSTAETLRTTGLPLFRVHAEECGDGSCGYGCGDIPVLRVKVPEKAAYSEECCEPVCGPETCG
ncbi:MAG: hypothetical protein ACRDIF_07585 [Actinomycetota bacterium]